MKKIFSIFAMAAVLVFAASCDKIDDPHKPFTPSAGGKTVLIKDFTGARCVNCPAAAEYAHDLQHSLGDDKVFIMAVHAGFLAEPMGNFPNFLTEEGTYWYNDNSSNPLFTVDHVSATDGNTLYVEQIDAPVSSGVSEGQTFDVQVFNHYYEDTRTIHTEADVMAVADVAGDFYVTVCLIEDSIVGWQTIPGGVDREYVFRNVFRKTFNGKDGDSFFKGQCFVNDEYVYKYEMELDSTYNVDQCYVLTYVSDMTDGKILQTGMQKVK